MQNNEKNLKAFRNEIDYIDSQIIDLFEKRMNVVSEISNYKKINNIPTTDFSRENEIIENLEKKYEDSNYKNYIKELELKMIELSKLYQLNKKE